MNIYLFGNFCGGYTQYPNDDSHKVFEELYSESKANAQLAIRRDGSMMYYAYIRKITEYKYCGICIHEVDKYYTDIDGLLSVFENCIEKLVCRGNILCFDASGNITTTLTDLYKHVEDIVLVASFIKQQAKHIFSTSKDLPPDDYSVSGDTVNYCNINESINDILYSSYTFGTTIILKEKDYDTIRLNSYKGILGKLNKENTTLKIQNQELQTINIKISRQKKQHTKVVLLILVIIGCAIGLFSLSTELNERSDKLDKKSKQLCIANKTITLKDSVIQKKLQIIQLQKNDINSLNTQLSTERDRMQEFKRTMENYMPILITDIQIGNMNKGGDIETDYGNSIYSSSTMYLSPKISYTGIKTGESINLNVKLYTPYGLHTGKKSPYGCTYSASMYVSSGDNTKVLLGWGSESRGNWKSGQYRFEIWYGNVCLKAKSFTVY